YTIDFVPAARLWVEADEIKLTQVIYNLINNAVTYTGPDKLVKIRQLLHRSGHGSRVRIEVIDTVEGIAPEQI
ncbi:MAG: ATP-binding protein, partial [Firmicutes bacterium]|nr:ATP-binding protein [Bacillota bacterium]